MKRIRLKKGDNEVTIIEEFSDPIPDIPTLLGDKYANGYFIDNSRAKICLMIANRHLFNSFMRWFKEQGFKELEKKSKSS